MGKPRDRKCTVCHCHWHSDTFDCCPRCEKDGFFRDGIPLAPEDDYEPVTPQNRDDIRRRNLLSEQAMHDMIQGRPR